MLIRWILGENLKQELHDVAYELLFYSIGYMTRLFPDARRVVMLGFLRDKGDRAKRDFSQFGVEFLNVSDYVTDQPDAVLDFTSWNAFSKAIPKRLDVNDYELRLDNDVLLWRKPEILNQWLKTENALLGLGCSSAYPCNHIGSKEQHGGPLAKVSRRFFDPNLHMNSGIVGFPPGYNPPALPIQSDWKKSEQGWTHLMYATYDGPKYLIPFDNIPLIGLNDWATLPEGKNLLQDYDGVHFIGHNFGWSTKYQDFHRYEISNHFNG